MYVNPTGLDIPGGHYSTASRPCHAWRKYAMTNEKIGPMFRKLVQTREYSLAGAWADADPVMFRTTNELLSMYEWIIGVKTGETPKAESCLVAAGTKDGTTC